MVSSAITTAIVVLHAVVGADLLDVSVDLRGATRGDRIGAALACGEDLDHDGVIGVELLIGAPEHDFSVGDEYESSGAVLWIQDLDTYLGSNYSFLDRNTVTAALVGRLRQERFGSSVTYGDLDSDGVSEVWVGAPGYRWGDVPNVEGFGRAYLFAGPNLWTDWNEDIEGHDILLLEIGLAGGPLIASLGDQVAIADVVGDGGDDLLALAPYFPGSQLTADDTSQGVGFAALYPNQDIDLSGDPVVADIRDLSNGIVAGGASSEGGLDRIIPLPDLDGDGVQDLAAVDLSPALVNEDQAGLYLFLSDIVPMPGVFQATQAGTKIRPQTTLDQMGAAVAVGDLDDDGENDLVVGMPGWQGTGAVAIFPGPSSGWPADMLVTEHAAIFVGDGQGSQLGWTLAVTDLDGDGDDDLVAAAPAMAAEGDLVSEVMLISGGEALDLTPGVEHAVRDRVQVSLLGNVHDGAGSAICLPGDLDGDGLPDLVIGAPDAAPGIGLAEAGRIFVTLSDSLPDADGDGLGVLYDCNDNDASVYPGATELCDGLDNDCDGEIPTDEFDIDLDGWSACGGDCDDADADLNLLDEDGDGLSTCDLDCDDLNPDLFPGQWDGCDDLDNDCDEEIDEDEKENLYFDRDVDGYGHPDELVWICRTEGYVDLAGDCNDRDADVHPDAEDPPGDGVDQDCDGKDFVGGHVCTCRQDGRPDLPVLGGLALASVLFAARRRRP